MSNPGPKLTSTDLQILRNTEEGLFFKGIFSNMTIKDILSFGTVNMDYTDLVHSSENIREILLLRFPYVAQMEETKEQFFNQPLTLLKKECAKYKNSEITYDSYPMGCLELALTGQLEKILSHESMDTYQKNELLSLCLIHGFELPDDYISSEIIEEALSYAAIFNYPIQLNRVLDLAEKIDLFDEELCLLSVYYAVTHDNLRFMQTLNNRYEDLINPDNFEQHFTWCVECGSQTILNWLISLHMCSEFSIEAKENLLRICIVQNNKQATDNLLMNKHFQDISTFYKVWALKYSARNNNLEMLPLILEHPCCQEITKSSIEEAALEAKLEDKIEAAEFLNQYLSKVYEVSFNNRSKFR